MTDWVKTVEHPILGQPRAVFRRLRSAWVRTLHPFRRYAAFRRIRRRLPIRKIAILCTGNICRSPYAEARLARAADGEMDLEVKSAGLMGSGRIPPDEAQASARARDLTVGDRRSQLFSLKLAKWADLILVMDPEQKRSVRREFDVKGHKILVLPDLDPEPLRHRSIFDPLGHPIETFEETFDHLDRCLDQLLGTLRGTR